MKQLISVFFLLLPALALCQSFQPQDFTTNNVAVARPAFQNAINAVTNGQANVSFGTVNANGGGTLSLNGSTVSVAGALNAAAGNFNNLAGNANAGGVTNVVTAPPAGQTNAVGEGPDGKLVVLTTGGSGAGLLPGGKFVETNHWSTFGVYPNIYMANDIGVTNLSLSTTLNAPGGFLGAYNIAVTPAVGMRVVINYAGPNCRYYIGTVSNVNSATSVQIWPPVTQGVTNSGYAFICNTNSDAGNSGALQKLLNSASNCINLDVICDPPSYYINTLGSNVVGCGFAFCTNGNWQLPTMNNAMEIIPPLLASNTNHLGGKATVTLEGQYPFAPWGGGPVNQMMFAPNETAVICDSLGNDQTGSNYIGNSFLDTRAFAGFDNVGAGPTIGGVTLQIPCNDVKVIVKNLTFLQSYDSGIALINLAGAADGSEIDNVNILGGDFGNTVGGLSYQWNLKQYPKDTNSLAIIMPNNFQGTYAFLNYVFVTGEWAALEEGQTYAVGYTSANCSNSIDMAYSPAVLMVFDHPQFAGQFAVVHMRKGIQTAPSQFFINDAVDFGNNVMPSGTNIDLIDDEYFMSDGVHDGFFDTVGHISYATNINGGASYVDTRNWNTNNTSLLLVQLNGNGVNYYNGQYAFGTLVASNFVATGTASSVPTFNTRINIAYNGNNGIGWQDQQSEIVGQGNSTSMGWIHNNNGQLYGRLTPIGNDSMYWVDRITSEYLGIANTNGVWQISSNIVVGGSIIGNANGTVTNLVTAPAGTGTNIVGETANGNMVPVGFFTGGGSVANAYYTNGSLANSLPSVYPSNSISEWNSVQAASLILTNGSAIGTEGPSNVNIIVSGIPFIQLAGSASVSGHFVIGSTNNTLIQDVGGVDSGEGVLGGVYNNFADTSGNHMDEWYIYGGYSNSISITGSGGSANSFTNNTIDASANSIISLSVQTGTPENGNHIYGSWNSWITNNSQFILGGYNEIIDGSNVQINASTGVGIYSSLGIGPNIVITNSDVKVISAGENIVTSTTTNQIILNAPNGVVLPVGNITAPFSNIGQVTNAPMTLGTLIPGVSVGAAFSVFATNILGGNSDFANIVFGTRGNYGWKMEVNDTLNDDINNDDVPDIAFFHATSPGSGGFQSQPTMELMTNGTVQAGSGFLVLSNAWSVPYQTNGMPNWSVKYTQSNGVPVYIYNSNGVAFVNYFGTGGGIIP